MKNSDAPPHFLPFFFFCVCLKPWCYAVGGSSHPLSPWGKDLPAPCSPWKPAFINLPQQWIGTWQPWQKPQSVASCPALRPLRSAEPEESATCGASARAEPPACLWDCQSMWVCVCLLCHISVFWANCLFVSLLPFQPDVDTTRTPQLNLCLWRDEADAAASSSFMHSDMSQSKQQSPSETLFFCLRQKKDTLCQSNRFLPSTAERSCLRRECDRSSSPGCEVFAAKQANY